jgi:DnaJ-domain-containing protein 1
MMGIFDRLGDLLKSYLNSDDRKTFGPGRNFGSENAGRSYADPDLEAAYEELDELLGHKADGKRGPADSSADSGAGSRAGEGGRASGGNRANERGRNAGRVPQELEADFAELGLPPGASAEDCKAAYKKLLKIHHPDRHAGHPGNMEKATRKSARINAAYDRIEKWRQEK